MVAYRIRNSVNNNNTQDQMAVLDHLGVHKCLLIGSCIGPA